MVIVVRIVDMDEVVIEVRDTVLLRRIDGNIIVLDRFVARFVRDVVVKEANSYSVTKLTVEVTNVALSINVISVGVNAILDLAMGVVLEQQLASF